MHASEFAVVRKQSNGINHYSKAKMSNDDCLRRAAGVESDSAEIPAQTDSRWQLWGPYMSLREWGTVRETGGWEGSNWTDFPYERAASTAYRYCEDGIFGVCDSECQVCHSYAFWNYRDDHLKERFYGLSNSQGVHGEDVKEVYSFKAADPQYRYICADFVYPQTEYPYRHLPQMETRQSADLELATSPLTAVRSAAVSLTDFNNWHREQRCFDIEFEMCKLSPERLFFQLSITNCSAESARLVAMPMLFLRNTWSPGQTGDQLHVEKFIRVKDDFLIVCFKNADGKEYHLGYYYDEKEGGHPEILLTDNLTNSASETGSKSGQMHFSKDAFHRYIVRGDSSGLMANLGNAPATKAGLCYRLKLAPKQQIKLRSFLMPQRTGETALLNWAGLTKSMEMVRLENIVDTYQNLPGSLIPTEQDILNAAYTNLLWNRQYYPLDRMPHLWRVFSSGTGRLPISLVTVPDKWEQPYLAAWDCALHCLCLTCFDLRQAIKELTLLLSLVRSDGSIYTDEYRPDGVTPPLIVLAAVDVYSKCSQEEKLSLAPEIYRQLKHHLKWWLHRTDARGVALIDGGICGVDYVSLFPRELVETGEGLIWAIFFLMRFLELALAIYTTPDIAAALIDAIEDDLPKLFDYLSRLCTTFARSVAQENGLYHPRWLDVRSFNQSNSAKASSDDNSSNSSGGNGNDAGPQKQDLDDSTPSISEESYFFDCGIDQTNMSATLPPEAPPEASTLENSATNEEAPACASEDAVGGERCPWLHAYCYLPILCCCSLPNVRLRSGHSIQDLLVANFNQDGSRSRAPFIFYCEDGLPSKIFVSVINAIDLSELLEQVLSEVQFLSQYGIRTMSMLHACDAATVTLSASCARTTADAGSETDKPSSSILSQEFCPGASVSASYGGNTNWYGGLNLPYNYLVIEAIDRWASVLDKNFDLIEYPSYCGRYKQLKDIVQDLAARNVSLFLPNASGIIPSTGCDAKGGLRFFETFDGETGRGHGAMHKGGWSAIVSRILLLMHGIK